MQKYFRVLKVNLRFQISEFVIIFIVTLMA